MKALNTMEFNCNTAEDFLSENGVKTTSVTEIIPDVYRFGYVSPKDNGMVYILETSKMYGPDGYITRAWSFRENFTDLEAVRFLEGRQDENREIL